MAENFRSKLMFGNRTFYITEGTWILSTKVTESTTELLPPYHLGYSSNVL